MEVIKLSFILDNVELNYFEKVFGILSVNGVYFWVFYSYIEKILILLLK